MARFQKRVSLKRAKINCIHKSKLISTPASPRMHELLRIKPVEKCLRLFGH